MPWMSLMRIFVEENLPPWRKGGGGQLKTFTPHPEWGGRVQGALQLLSYLMLTTTLWGIWQIREFVREGKWRVQGQRWKGGMPGLESRFEHALVLEGPGKWSFVEVSLLITGVSFLTIIVTEKYCIKFCSHSHHILSTPKWKMTLLVSAVMCIIRISILPDKAHCYEGTL